MKFGYLKIYRLDNDEVRMTFHDEETGEELGFRNFPVREHWQVGDSIHVHGLTYDETTVGRKQS